MQTTFETPEGTDPGATLSPAAPDAIPGGIPRGVEINIPSSGPRRRRQEPGSEGTLEKV
jgi:hypothetical protein